MVSRKDKFIGLLKSPNADKKLKAMSEFVFDVPEEAPIFYPTEEEFQNPLEYIKKIRCISEKFGICKIIPPQSWQPPFTVDVDNFKFTPRIQHLNELEAKTRIKLNFLDQIAKFWELQGSTLKIPMVERRALDLYSLHKIILEEGGLEVTTKERKWSKVASRMGYPQGKSIGTLLKSHYERILYPFDIFQQEKNLSQITLEHGIKDVEQDKQYKPHRILSRQAILPPCGKYNRRSKRFAQGEIKDFTMEGENKELRRLQCFGAGPKMSGFPTIKLQKPTRKKKPKRRTRKSSLVTDPLAKYICNICSRGDVEESMLLCDGCDDSYHTFCLMPPLSEIPKGDWRCPKCVAQEVSKPMEAFGFEQAQREYTLQQFGEMADQFKSEYFNMPVNMVPENLVEKEFWRIVSSIDEDVTVEYGADLHTVEHGSGFPTKSKQYKHPIDQEYAHANWNLNNLPVQDGSVLKYINADISGMKIPWMYVGMCFATFCWHNEDHWSYSINYMHWGEPKTWYGVPGNKADNFESAMKMAAPELFQLQPDLLHQLVTIMNPNILMNAGVPVCRTDQRAGEFVITFPRAYHAGFNQGYNFAEAVNFAPADWLKIGRECIAQYALLRRFCVFSHDELVCKMAVDPESLDMALAAATYNDMIKMVVAEKHIRNSLQEWGAFEAEREVFELIPEDERQCKVCKTTCFLSAVTCICDSEHLVCLQHYANLCDCPPEKHTLRYRYTLEELPHLMEKLKIRAESFKRWFEAVSSCLEGHPKQKMDLAELKILLFEAENDKFPESELFEKLRQTVQKAEKCEIVAKQLATRKLRNRTCQSMVIKKYDLTYVELQQFYEEIDNLPCHIEETKDVKSLLDKVNLFMNEVTHLLSQEVASTQDIKKYIECAKSFELDIPEVAQLKQMLLQMEWLEEVDKLRKDGENVTLETFQKYLNVGMNLPSHPVIDKYLNEIQHISDEAKRWEKKAKYCLQSKSTLALSTVEDILKEADLIPAYLPNYSSLLETVKRAQNWSYESVLLYTGDFIPYIDVLENIVNRGHNISIQFDALPFCESQLNDAKKWREKTSRIFLHKNSHYSLMEVLSPRVEMGVASFRQKKSRLNDQNIPNSNTHVINGVKLEGKVDPFLVVAAFKEAEHKEMVQICNLRNENLKKQSKNPIQKKFCICLSGISDDMLECELCKDLFHASCVPLPPKITPKKCKRLHPQQTSAVSSDVKFLCPCCFRSRRPRIETVISLLVSLQKLPVRLPEGDALECLTERAMSWQDRARQILSSEEVASALLKLSVLTQQMTEAAARKKTERIINNELKKAANKPELHRMIQAISSQSSVVSDDSLSSQPNSPLCETRSADEDNKINCDIKPLVQIDEPHDEETDNSNMATLRCEQDDSEGCLNSISPSEHTYSTVSKQIIEGHKKHSRKTPLIPRQMGLSPLILSEPVQSHLEKLMLEGDLLEVTLDETYHIWKILQNTKFGERLSDFEDEVNDPYTNQQRKRKIREKYQSRNKALKTRTIIKRFEEYQNQKFLEIDIVKSHKQYQISEKTEEKTNIDGNENNMNENSTSNQLSYDSGNAEIKDENNSIKGYSDDDFYMHHNFDDGTLAGGNNSTWVGVGSTDIDVCIRANGGVDVDASGGVFAGGGIYPGSDSVTSANTKTDISRCNNLTDAGAEADIEDDDDDDDDDDDEYCAATTCLKPSGREVNWVQCDKCEKWFHLRCIGLNKKDVNEDEDYICKHCLVPTKAKRVLGVDKRTSRTSRTKILTMDVEEK